MNQTTKPIKVALRIPGQWAHPKELVERLPDGFHLSPDTLTMPDGAEIEFGAAKADNQFAEIFHSSCRQPPTDDELATVDNYTVNAFLAGPGGSMAAARTMMQAGSALVRAGGAGVFIDNSTVAHGGQNWLAMTDDGSPDALSFAFVAIVRSKAESYTVGMHVLGLRDVVMKNADAEADDFGIIDVVRYLSQSDKPVDDGHVLADLNGPRFRTYALESADAPAGSPVYNPFGRLKLVSFEDIAETN